MITTQSYPIRNKSLRPAGQKQKRKVGGGKCFMWTTPTLQKGWLNIKTSQVRLKPKKLHLV